MNLITSDNYLEGASALPSVDVTIAVSNNFVDKGNEEFIAFLSKYETSSAITSEVLLICKRRELTM